MCLEDYVLLIITFPIFVGPKLRLMTVKFQVGETIVITP